MGKEVFQELWGSLGTVLEFNIFLSQMRPLKQKVVNVQPDVIQQLRGPGHENLLSLCPELLFCLPEQPAGADSALSRRLDYVISRDLFQPQLLGDSVTVPPFFSDLYFTHRLYNSRRKCVKDLAILYLGFLKAKNTTHHSPAVC